MKNISLTILAIHFLFISFCGETQALADVTILISDNIQGLHNNQGYDFYESTNINPNNGYGQTPYSVRSNLHFEGGFNTNGTWVYYDFERKFDGTNVSRAMRIAGQALDSPYVGVNTWPFAATATISVYLQVNEDMAVQYIPDSNTDLPPSSISFQPVYLVEGQLLGHGWDCQTTPVVSQGSPWEMDDISFYSGTWPIASVNTPQSISISTTIVAAAQTANLENGSFVSDSFVLGNALNGTAIWQSLVATDVPASIYDYEYYLQADSFDLRYTFLGFANPVDQNTNPVPLSKLDFYYVGKSDTSQQFGISPPPTIETIALQANQVTNCLVIQWPSYATNYQLESSTNLTHGWCTNSLLSPIQNGAFLQVCVPTTNAVDYFRLIRLN